MNKNLETQIEIITSHAKMQTELLKTMLKYQVSMLALTLAPGIENPLIKERVDAIISEVGELTTTFDKVVSELNKREYGNSSDDAGD